MNFPVSRFIITALAVVAAFNAPLLPGPCAANDQLRSAGAAPTDRPRVNPPGPYRLGAGDEIEIRFFFNPELNDRLQIRPDGRISLPFIGEVEMAGKSVEEAVAGLEQLYAKHLTTPRIWIQVRQYASQKVFVTGEVVRPGVLPLMTEVTVMDAIGEAGGIKHTGARSAVLIRRGTDGNPVVHKLTLWKNGKPGPEAMMLLRPFDVVMVPESKIARVDRWVDQHIRQLNPAMMSLGFSYLANVKSGSTQTTFPAVVF